MTLKPDSGNGQSAEEIAANKAAAEALAAKGQSATTPAAKGQPESDLKAQLEAERLAKEKAENQFKEYQRGVTPKLERLAEIEKAEIAKATVTQPDEIKQFDEDIVAMKDLISRMKSNRDEDGNPAPLITTDREVSLRQLERDRARVIREREDVAFQGKYNQVGIEHPEFTDFPGLNKIILEYHKERGEKISPTVAYDIYEARRQVKAAADSANITAENKLLGDKAAGQGGGKPATKEGEERAGDVDRKRLFGV